MPVSTTSGTDNVAARSMVSRTTLAAASASACGTSNSSVAASTVQFGAAAGLEHFTETVDQMGVVVPPVRHGHVLLQLHVEAIGKLARETKTPFMSASSLRFVPDIVKLRGELPQIGNVYLASAACGNELIYYGIHALSMIYGVLGGGAVSAINVGQPGANLVRLRFENHRDVMLIVGEKQWMRAGYQINLYGEKGWRSVQPDLTNLYSHLLEAFISLLDTGKESVPIEEEVELIAALEAGKRSLELGREVELREVLA